MGELFDLTPDPQAVMEVIMVHEQLDPPNSPIYLSAFAELDMGNCPDEE